MSISRSTHSALNNAGTILRALDATADWRALMLTAASLAVFMLVASAGAVLAGKMLSPWIEGMFLLFALVLLTLGISATGFMMMDNAYGSPSRSVGDALISSVFSVHRLLLSLLVSVVAYGLWLLLLGLMLLICKIPGLGPMLYTVVFPLSILITSGFLVFIAYAGIGVIAPSVWDSGSVMDTMASLWAITRERFMSLLILSILLGLLAGAISALIFGVLFSGFMLVAGFSAGILGSPISAGLSADIMGMMMGVSEGGGYMTAAMVGGGMLFCLAAAIPVNILILGTCINYRQLTDGLDISKAHKEIQDKLDETRQRAEAARTRAQDLQQQDATPTQAAAMPQPDADDTAASSNDCTACGFRAAPEDVFCGNCGAKLS